tara:strand:- start:2295 stop:2552 length:258 start_codon:yes stop_codon:yes gene_type:complete
VSTQRPRTSAAALNRADWCEFLVFCDGCASCDSGELQQQGSAAARAEAARLFKADGWTWTRAGGWRCLACSPAEALGVLAQAVPS